MICVLFLSQLAQYLVTVHPAHTCPHSFFPCSANDVWIGDLWRGYSEGPQQLSACLWLKTARMRCFFHFIHSLCQSCNRWTHNHPRVPPFTRIVLNCVCVWGAYKWKSHSCSVSLTVSQIKCLYTHVHKNRTDMHKMAFLGYTRALWKVIAYYDCVRLA